jgi:hypothetical protein
MEERRKNGSKAKEGRRKGKREGRKTEGKMKGMKRGGGKEGGIKKDRKEGRTSWRDDGHISFLVTTSSFFGFFCLSFQFPPIFVFS